MITGTDVTAQWALIAKAPGSSNDYGVLAASDGGADLRHFVGVYVTGAPSSSAPLDTPSAPPWVTFGSHPAQASQPMISVTVLDWWQGVDHASRPIWPRRFFLFGYEELAMAGASYQTLWEAVQGTGLPLEDQELRLCVAPQNVDALVATISDFGFERLATLAAAMLEGPVGLVGAAHLPREERLALLDAVSALLPYGFRADLSASSAVDNTVAHKIRLVFADFSNNQFLMPLKDGDLPELEPGLARDYLDQLLKKRDRSGLTALIAHLWSARRACSFERPRHALKILAELDLHGHLMRDVADGVETRAEVIRFFQDPVSSVQATWGRADMEPWMRDRLVARLLERPDETAANLLSRNWGTVVNDLTRFILRTLDQGSTEWAAWCLAAARAVPHGQAEDDLLAYLLVPELGPAGIQRHDALIRLLRGRDVPQVDTFRFTCEKLRLGPDGIGQPGLVRDLLLREMTESSRAPHWVHWLCLSVFRDRRERAAWAVLLELAVTGSADDWPAGRAELDRDPSWLALMLRLASQAEHLKAVLESVGFALVETALIANSEQARAELAAALDVALWPLHAEPGTVAIADVARVLLGGAPRDFPLSVRRREIFDLYGEALENGLRLAAGREPALQAAFLRHAVRTGFDGRLTDGTVWLVKIWSADEDRAPSLARFIVEQQIATVLLRDDRLDERFWLGLVGHEPSLRPFAAGLLLRAAMRDAAQEPRSELRRESGEHGVSATRLALAMYNAHRVGMKPREILDIMGGATSARNERPSRLPPSDLDTVIREFQGLLFYQPAQDMPPYGSDRERAAEEVLFECYRHIADGVFGDSYARAFRAHIDRRLADEIDTRKWLRRELKRRRRRRAHARAAVQAVREDGDATRPEPGPARLELTPSRLELMPPRSELPQRLWPAGAAGAEVATIETAREEIPQAAYPRRWHRLRWLLPWRPFLWLFRRLLIRGQSDVLRP